MPTLLRTLAITALLTVTLSAAAAAKLYRWTDAQGHVHYSDQPGGNAREIDPKAPAAVPAVAAASSPDAGACQKKKDQLASYRGATTITETDGLGQTREYSDAQKQKLIETTEKSIHEVCGAS